MPVVNADQFCDVTQGFNFRKDVQTKVGFITKLRVGKGTMKVDFVCKDPENNQTDKKVVGVMQNVNWVADQTSPVTMVAFISNANRQTIQQLLMVDMSDLSVDFQFDVYTYDPDEKKYYKCLTTKETDMKGLLFKEGSMLSCEVEEESNMQVQEPKNFRLRITVKPEAKQQEIHYATSVSGKLVLAWGVTQS